MDITLQTHHRIAAIPMIRDFVTAVARYYGADRHEEFEVALAVEEAAEHIINTYPENEAESPFNIACRIEGEKLRVILSNTGLPVNIENIPEYDNSNPGASIDGLKFFLIDKLSDSFRFVNLGSQGWQTIIDKKIKNLKYYSAASGNSSAATALPSGKLDLAIATPADAFAITKLAYLTYRYTYAKKIFYYPDLLEEKIAAQQIISFIIKNEQQEIVAHSAILRSENCQSIAEAGAIMTRPEYRRSSAIMRLVKATNKFLKSANNPGIVFLESNLVTAHTGSQRICRSFKFIPLALKLSVYNRANFVDIAAAGNRRETLLYSMLPYSMPPATSIFPPREHRQIIEKLIDRTGLQIKIEKQCCRQLPDKPTQLSVQRYQEQQFAGIVVNELGNDFPAALERNIYQISLNDARTIALYLNLSEPLPEDIDAQLRQRQFFFSGIKPQTTTTWQIIYTRLEHHRLDFAAIAVIDKLAVELRDYIAQCYQQVIPL